MKKTFLLIFILANNLIFSQKETDNLIVTYYDDSSGHGIEFYTWIIPVESIKNVSRDYSILPLYTESFSKNNFDNCFKNKEVDMFISYVGTNYNLDNKHKNNIKKLIKLIKEESILIHDISIKKKYPIKEKNRLKIFITPVTGNFKYCKIKESSGKRINYQGKVAFPISNFYLNTKILNENVQDFIYSFDFSQLKFINDIK